LKYGIVILSIIGSLFGLASGFMVTAAGELFGEATMSEDGASVFWLSALAFALGFAALKWSRISGWGLILIALFGLWNNGLFYIVAALFLIAAGIMSLRYGKKQRKAIESGTYSG
jgi:hypothetical protein